MVTITSSYIVIPNEPTSNGHTHFWLSENDQMMPVTHTSFFYIYKAQPNVEAIEKMRHSLSEILVPYYPVAGRLRRIEGGRMVLDCNAKGVILVEAESTKTLAEYGDFSSNETIKDLIPMVDYTQPIEELPLLLVHLTRFYGTNQGIAIAFSLSHTLCDGLSIISFINTWAKLVRGDSLEVDELSPVLDRSILNSLSPLSEPRFHHEELKPFPLKLGSSDSIQEQKKETIAVTLKLTQEQVEKLKKKANDQYQKEVVSRPYTRYEAIASYIWRCASKARHLDKLQPTRLRFTVGIRSRTNPPLPRNYFGNAHAPSVTPTCFVGDIISKPLSYVAQKVREATELIQNEYIRSQHDFIKCQEQLDEVRASFQHRKEHRKNSLFFGNPNLSIVSWTHLPWLAADFGWGKPMYFGPGLLSLSDRAYVIGSPDGSIIISMHFQKAHMQLFTKFFWEEILVKGKL